MLPAHKLVKHQCSRFSQLFSEIFTRVLPNAIVSDPVVEHCVAVLRDVVGRAEAVKAPPRIVEPHDVDEEVVRDGRVLRSISRVDNISRRSKA